MTEHNHCNHHLILKGATIMGNGYRISRDQDIFPDPRLFKWTLFLLNSLSKLRADILNPMEFAFRFGNRTYPGRYLADRCCSAISRIS